MSLTPIHQIDYRALLKESISDSSSDEEDQQLSRRRAAASPLHKSTSGDPERTSSSQSTDISYLKHELIEVLPDSNEADQQQQIVEERENLRAAVHLPPATTTTSSSSSSSLVISSPSAPSGIQTLGYHRPPPKAYQPLPIDVAEPVPLRKRSYSDLQDRTEAVSQRLARSSQEKETPERWRGRLWPGKAIIAFCRVITRCVPPAVNPRDKIRLKRGHTELVPHWKEADIPKIGTHFPTITSHSSTFFLLTVEESRDAVMKEEDSNDLVNEEDHEGGIDRSSVNGASNGWVDCEVVNIVNESEYGSVHSANDVRLGSVWVVKVAIRSPNVTLDDSRSNTSSRLFARDGALAGGDLVILSSQAWQRHLLGIVQPWDPDYDFKFGINFGIPSQIHASMMAEGAEDMTTANLLICVDSGESASAESLGGWASPGTIHSGVVFQMAVLGNVMTYIRECQALMSLKLLHPRLRDVVLNMEDRQRVSYVTESIPATAPGPSNVPCPLWKALVLDHNESQLRALRMVCRRDAVEDVPASPICLLQGPPGTGKTKTILAILSVFLAGALKPSSKATKVVAGSSFRSDEIKRVRADSFSNEVWSPGRTTDRPRILVCAPSNTAVDELVYRVITQGLLGPDGARLDDVNVVRIGHALKDEYLKRNKSHVFQDFKSRHHLSDQDNNILRIVERVSLDNIVEDRRRVLQATDGQRQLGCNFKYSDIRKQILEKADIVACTLSGAGSQPILEVVLRITGFKFDAVIIDEAAQAVEPSSLIPFKFNPQIVVMVGDPCQLPATVFSRACKEANYSQSLFLRLQRSGIPVAMLETQYRMHPLIAEFPSQRYYNNCLLTDASILAPDSMHHLKPYYPDKSGLFRPIVFHDLQYGRESLEHCSVCNHSEARYVVALFDQLLKHYPKETVNVGIIAPYRAQRRLIIRTLKNTFGKHLCSQLDIEVSTVDGFQGREKDIIIFSCVRAARAAGNAEDTASDNIGRGIGFLKEWQRLNVAITRARFALWIVGNQQTLRRDSEWRALLDYFRSKNAILGLTREKALQDYVQLRSLGSGGSSTSKKSAKSKHKEHHHKKGKSRS